MASADEEGMFKQAQNIWAMLDNMAADDPQAYKKFIDQNLKEGKEFMEWKQTPPDAHMCLQSQLLEPSKTLYINVCSWKRVPEPKSDDAPVPVMTSDIDNVNGDVSTVNVAFAPSVLEVYGRGARNQDQQTSLINLAIDYVQDVHKVRISRTYKLLPDDKPYHGNWHKIVHSLRAKMNIKDQDESFEDMLKSVQRFAPETMLSKETIVTELNKMKNGETDSVEMSDIVLPSNMTPRKKVLIEEIQPVNERGIVVEPGYTLRCLNADQENSRRLLLTVTLNGVTSVNECQLELSDDFASLEVENRYRLRLRLPEQIKDDLARAKFHKKTSTLSVTLPTVK